VKKRDKKRVRYKSAGKEKLGNPRVKILEKKGYVGPEAGKARGGFGLWGRQ